METRTDVVLVRVYSSKGGEGRDLGVHKKHTTAGVALTKNKRIMINVTT